MADTPPTVQYLLQKLYVGGAKIGSYYGRCVPRATLGHTQLAQAIVDSGSTLNYVDIVAVLLALSETIERELVKGNSITLGDLVNLQMTMRGTFDTLSTPRTPGLQDLEPSAHFGARLRRNLMLKCIPERIDPSTIIPVINTYYDSMNGSGNLFTSGAIATIRGKNLVFNPQNENEGIFFIETDGPTVQRVNAYGSVSHKAVTFLAPSVEHESSDYRLEIRCLAHLEHEEMRTGSLLQLMKYSNLTNRSPSAYTIVKGVNPRTRAKIEAKKNQIKEVVPVKTTKKK